MSIKTADAKLDEIVERTRRIETRLTRYMEQEGFETGIERASWMRNGTVNVPSPAIGINEVLKVIPPGRAEPVPIIHKGRELATITLSEDDIDPRA